MDIFLKETRNCKALVFIDLEATSPSFEMIEIGAYLAEIYNDGSIKKIHEPFKHYVKAKHPIGPIVTKITGITEELLQKEGENFSYIMPLFRRYVGRFWANCRFVTFGEHDMVIIRNTMEQNRDFDPQYARNIYKHHFDLQKFLDTYIQDEHGNPYSLSNYLKVFGLTFDGQAHDALCDALNLLDLYKKARVSKDIFVREYKKTLLTSKNKPIVKEILKMLSANQTITPEIYDALLENSFK